MMATPDSDSADDQRLVEVSVQVDLDAVDDIVRLLERHCPGGTAVEEPGDDRRAETRVTVKGYIPASDTDTQRKVEIALLLLSRDGSISEPTLTTLEQKDWTESWKASFKPMRIGHRTVIVPTWHTYESHPGQVIVRIDPGMAFGTGLHSTTRLCIIAAERLVRTGMRILDVGTGSGILAILSVLLGAESALGLDTDPLAVQTARENAAVNGVDNAFSIVHGTLDDTDEQTAGTQYDLVLANILAEVIIDMASGLAKAVAPGGALVASGILTSKADKVADALVAEGLAIEERITEGEWTALIVRKA